MIPAHIKAILDQHGGADGDPTPPDSGGLITYRASDGAWVVAQTNGDIVSQGSSPGNVTSGAQAAPVKRGVGTYTQAELEARLAQSPGLVYQGQKQKTLPGVYQAPPTEVAVVSWKDPKTNEIVEAQVDPENGTYTVTQDGPGGKNPPAAAAAALDPNSPQGRAAAATATTDEIKAQQAQREAAESAANAALPPDQDPRYETNAARAERAQATIRQQGIDARANEADQRGKDADARSAAAVQAAGQPKTTSIPVKDRPGISEVTTVTPATATSPGTTETHYVDASGKVVPPPTELAKDTPVAVVRNGVSYTQHTVTKSDGTAGDIYYTKPGSTERVTPPDLAPDTPTAAAPKMPNFVLGGSQAALTQYHDALQQGVTTKQWTQKWADDRWGEAVQMAQQVNQDYATQQNEVESTRNAQIDLAKSRATLGQNALTMALDHVDKINGLLPENSPLGGQVFGALLGINMLMQARSGIDTVNPSARPSVPTLTPADMASPQAIAPVRAAVATQVSQAAATAKTPLLPPPPPVPGQAPAAPAAAAPSAPPAVAGTPSPLGDTGAPPMAPAVYTDPTGNVYRADGKIWSVGPSGTPRAIGPWDPAKGPPPGATPAGPQTQSAAPPMATPGPTPDTGIGPTAPVGGRVLPQPVVGVPPILAPYQDDQRQPAGQPGNDPTAPVEMAPPPSLPPILAQYQPQPAAPPATRPPMGPPIPSLSPAMLATKARMTPPWQLSVSDIEQMQAAGVDPNDIWSVPGAPGVAA